MHSSDELKSYFKEQTEEYPTDNVEFVLRGNIDKLPTNWPINDFDGLSKMLEGWQFVEHARLYTDINTSHPKSRPVFEKYYHNFINESIFKEYII